MDKNKPTNKSWYSIKNQGETTDVYIYDAVGYETGAKEFIASIEGIKNTINLHLNTPGGDVFEGNNIYNALMRHESKVHVFVDGLAASIGSIIAMAGDTVSIAKNGFFMIHNPYQVAMGDSKQLRKNADVLDKIRDSLVATYVGKTGRDVDEIKQWMDDETWFDSEEAVEYGFADSIYEGEETISASHDLRTYSNVPEPVVNIYQADVADEDELSERKLEKSLRDAGCSRKHAKAILVHGFKGARQRDAETREELSSLTDKLNNLNEFIKGE